MVAILGSGIQGCSQGGSVTVAEKAVSTRQVLALRNGDSLGEVLEALGSPESKAVDGAGDGALHYGRWQLMFEDGKLKERIEELRRVEQWDSPRGRDPVQKVLSLRSGMTISAVRALLGKPEVIELVYREGPEPVRVLRYGPWELQFRKGALQARTHW